MKKLKISFTVLRILIYIAMAIIFFIMPLNSVEGKSFCSWYNTFGLICPTCGFTRGFTCIMHGAFDKAFDYNQVLVFFVVPTTLFIMVQDIYTIIRRNIKKEKRMSFIEFIFRPDIYFGK